MLILSIDTSTHVCSVALAENGKNIAFSENNKGQLHAAIITTQIQELFEKTGYKPHNLAAIAVSKGPGSYTGLRIGVSAAKGLCYALDIPLLGISTLQALAWGAINNTQSDLPNALYIPMIDAMRMEVYAAVYTHTLTTLQEPQAIILNEQSFEQFFADNYCYYFGTGAAKCVDLLTHKNAIYLPDVICSAKNMAALAYDQLKVNQTESMAYFNPEYIKPYYTTNKVLQNITT